jgi:hypothetical protein
VADVKRYAMPASALSPGLVLPPSPKINDIATFVLMEGDPNPFFLAPSPFRNREWLPFPLDHHLNSLCFLLGLAKLQIVSTREISCMTFVDLLAPGPRFKGLVAFNRKARGRNHHIRTLRELSR